MTLNYATLTADTVEADFNIDSTHVKIWMPLSNLSDIEPGTLHNQVETYINRMFNIADLLG